MDPGLVRDAVTALLGLATGVLSGLFGVGGGVISQPGMRLLGVEPLVAIGTALPAIIPGAASGTCRYSREGLIRWRAVAATVPVGLVAAAAGGFLAEEVPGEGHLLQLATACLLGFSAWRMARQPDRPAIRHEPLAESDAPEAPTGAEQPPGPGPEGATTGTFAAIGATSGLLSGLLGIGGGVLMVPAFTSWVRLTIKEAVATSLVCVGVLAVPGTITHAILGNVDWAFAIPLAIAVVPGAQLGAHLTIRASARSLRLAVAIVLGLIAIAYATGEILVLAV